MLKSKNNNKNMLILNKRFDSDRVIFKVIRIIYKMVNYKIS